MEDQIQQARQGGSGDVPQSKQKNHDIDDELEELIEQRKADIKVIGSGGAGNNTISRLVEVGIEGCETIAMNTDAQDLLYANADEKVLIGKELTGGLGAGADPKVGEESAKESQQKIKQSVEGSDMVFITCGLGGGTGTGSAPVIAEQAKKQGALTVGIVTLPFEMEGQARQENAEYGLERLEEVVDTLIVIPNDKLLEIVPDVSLNTAFKIADEILVNAVKGVTELVTKPGLVNLDFADIRAVMGEGGIAMIGMGQSDTDSRATEAVQKALSNPLLDVEIEGGKGALVNVTGGTGLSLNEAQEVVNTVSGKLSESAKIIWGAQVREDMDSSLQAMIIVTGVDSPQIYGPDNTHQDEYEDEIEQELGVEFI
ncbi:MAG: cell division protein FtsZ [Nanohaloarchaea archaeon SW_7_46_7]|nr:MAG: cell division protein FtsZ [Nanohaloarchaea archaeon SW_7_46_7]